MPTTGGHTGIVVGRDATVSANSTTVPPGVVTINAWGFRPAGGNGEGPNGAAPVVRQLEGR